MFLFAYPKFWQIQRGKNVTRFTENDWMRDLIRIFMKCQEKIDMHDLFLNIEILIRFENNWNVVLPLPAGRYAAARIYTFFS